MPLQVLRISLIALRLLYLKLENIVLQFPLELEEAADGQFALQVGPEKVGRESRAAAGCPQSVARGGAIPVPHAHAGLRTDYTLHL